METEVGRLNAVTFNNVVNAVVGILHRAVRAK